MSTVSIIRRNVGNAKQMLPSSRPQTVVSSTSPGVGQSCSSGGVSTQDSQRLNFSTKCRCCAARISVIFVSIRNDIDWDQNRNRNEEVCTHNSASVSAYGKFSPDGSLTFLGPGDEEKWYGTLSHKTDGKWHVTAEEMMRIFAESGHPVFRVRSSEAL